MIDLSHPENLDLVSPFDPVLTRVAAEVPLDGITSSQVQSVIDRMIQISEGKGHSAKDSRQMVGLAAVQIGALLRIISIDITADGSNKNQNLEIIINPIITSESDEQLDGREGCWSCDDICGNVERSAQVTLGGYDRVGSPVTHDLTGFVARIAQHEVDHLDGIRFPDRIPVGQPERLHLVKPAEFEQYRSHWQNWPNLCPRGQWIAMRDGSKN